MSKSLLFSRVWLGGIFSSTNKLYLPCAAIVGGGILVSVAGAEYATGKVSNTIETGFNKFIGWFSKSNLNASRGNNAINNKKFYETALAAIYGGVGFMKTTSEKIIEFWKKSLEELKKQTKTDGNNGSSGDSSILEVNYKTFSEECLLLEV